MGRDAENRAFVERYLSEMGEVEEVQVWMGRVEGPPENGFRTFGPSGEVTLIVRGRQWRERGEGR